MGFEDIHKDRFYNSNHKNSLCLFSCILNTGIKKQAIRTGIFWIVLIIPVLLFTGCTKRNENLKITFTGDLMLDRGTRTVIEAHGPDFLFDNVNEVIGTSDYVVANLECAVCDAALTPMNKKFTFRSNREWLLSLYNHNITHVTLANNHSFDFGEEGIKQTIANLDRVGMKPIGYCGEGNTTCPPVSINKKDISITVFSSCFLKQNVVGTAYDSASVLSEKIKAYKGLHPTSIIVICLHWGIEKEPKPTSEQVEQAHLLINSGADLIIGHHPHVVQSIEVYQGKYIFYSLGNFIFDNNHSQAIMTDLVLSKGRIKTIQIIPINIVKSKPQLMNSEESENFRKQIQSLSNTIEIKQKDGIWKIL
ncbi:MAG: CapA family protein [Paludibacter sp.]|nr:CapA family protein [Paludibacter sp.]